MKPVIPDGWGTVHAQSNTLQKVITQPTHCQWNRPMWTRDKEGHFLILILKGPVHQENILMYAPNKQSPKMCEAKSNRIEGRNRQSNNNS